MTNTKLAIIIGAMLLVLGVVLYLLFGRGVIISDNTDEPAAITNFEECIAAGNPIMESYPPQCMANGEVFVADETATVDTILISSPTEGYVTSSPLEVTGSARGFWYFEGEFNVYIYDDRGEELGIGIATAQGDWMTEGFVPFTGQISFENPTTPGGRVVFKQSDPSGILGTLQEAMVTVSFE
jgi:hypothetical protein